MNSSRGLALFLARLYSNSHKDSFAVRLGASLMLAKFGIIGKWADLLAGLIIRPVMGLLIESGIWTIDLTWDAIREGRKLAEFEKLASEAYAKATAKIYTEREKDEIRKQYLEIISGIGNVGNPQ